MYCYGSSFHASRLRLVIATPSAMMQQTRAIVASQTATVTRPITVTGSTILPSPNEKVSKSHFCTYVKKLMGKRMLGKERYFFGKYFMRAINST